MAERTSSALLKSFLPQGTFWRFLMAGAAIAVLTTAAAMAAARIIALNLMHELQEESSYAVLRSAVDQIGRSRISDESLRNFHMEQRKDSLRRSVQSTLTMLDSYQRQILLDGRDPAEARATAMSRLNVMSESLEGSVFIIDGAGRLAVHPDPAFRGLNINSFQDVMGEYVLRDLVRQARASGKDCAFTVYNWINRDQLRMEPKLAGAKYYPAWELTVCSDLFLGGLPEELQHAMLASLNELRARIGEIEVGKHGYVFVLDEECNTVLHPTLMGKDAAEVMVPGKSRSICELVREAAEKPWGRNKIEYLWDRPDQRGAMRYRKVAWCTREPTTGWLVGVSAYVDEVEAGLPRFMAAIFFPSLGAILLLAGALALIIRNLLRPVQGLSRVCQAVSMGDLTALAREDVPGEMGFLARHFNIMVRRLRGLRRKEERRRLELEELNRELERVVELRTRALKRKARNLEEANRSLRELDAMKSAFLSSVSHELRTPLTSVLGFAKLISRDFSRYFWPLAPDDKARKHGKRVVENLEIILSEGERLTRLINDVLDINKIESGRVDWNDREVDIGEVVARAVQAVSGQFAQRPELDLQVDLQPGLPRMVLDFDRMVQVLVNLLNNAAKFTQRGTVRVSAARENGMVRLVVEDTGIGIPGQDLERIFDKFHQVRTEDTLKEKPQGTGLGLAICRQIVEHYGGTIFARSELGKGTALVVELPVERREPEAVTPQEDEPLGGESDRALVLVADDDRAVNAYLAQLLEEEGFETIQAFDGESAVKKAGAYQPDLVIMDIMMPGLDGRAAIRLLRRDERTAGIPVLVVSALQNLDDMGGDAAMTKPIDEAAFLAAVNGLLRRDLGRTPILAVKHNGDVELTPFYAMCQGCIEHCTEEEMWDRIAQGFQGTVIIPAWAVDRMDLSRMSNIKGVHFMVIPDRCTLDSSGPRGGER